MIYLIGFAIFILFVHYVGDFLLQSRKMADNKSKSLKWLSLHVLTYTFNLLIFTSVFVFDFGIGVLYWIALNGVLHWITDFFTSKLTTHYYKKEDWKSFFSVVGFDQFVHGATLLGTLLMWM
jgi:hypothetical protein